ncbi:MAG: hypothetical protein WC866_00555 [Patescibacteria group bacterium]
MPFSKPFEQTFPATEARERLFQVSATDLAERTLRLTQVYGRWPAHAPKFCDVWAAATIDGVLYGDFCVDIANITDEARFMALRRLLGDDVAEMPERQALQNALREEPKTLLLAMWGQDTNDEAFLALYYHPCFQEEEAKRWLTTLLGRGCIRSGLES